MGSYHSIIGTAIPPPASLINSLELLGNIIMYLVRTSILERNFEGLTLLSIAIVTTRATNWTADTVYHIIW